ncbi:MAG TPA: phosphoribosyltransferase family protein [Gemmataceae bacterium]
MYRDREDAALRLAQELKGRPLRNPLVLAIPRGGVVTGSVLARELGAELDVILCRKIPAPDQPELAVGAVSEDGVLYTDPHARELLDLSDEYLEAQRRRQVAEIERRKELFRAVRPQAEVAGRSVIVADDGIATGSTVIAALKVLRARGPHELIVATPVGSPDRLEEVRAWCDDVVCPLRPEYFWAIGQFYEDFSPVEDETAVEILRRFAPAPPAPAEAPAR